MPEKDPSLWITVLAALWNALPEPIKAAIIATLVALVRVMYDDREPRTLRRLLEAALCGAIALCIASLSEAIGLPSGYATFAGGAVGLLGAEQVREWARRIAQRRVEGMEGRK